MISIIKNNKSKILVLLVLVISFGAWNMYKKEQINYIPEKAELVFYYINNARFI